MEFKIQEKKQKHGQAKQFILQLFFFNFFLIIACRIVGVASFIRQNIKFDREKTKVRY